jgi:hypothetical protein
MSFGISAERPHRCRDLVEDVCCLGAGVIKGDRPVDAVGGSGAGNHDPVAIAQCTAVACDRFPQGSREDTCPVGIVRIGDGLHGARHL